VGKKNEEEEGEENNVLDSVITGCNRAGDNSRSIEKSRKNNRRDKFEVHSDDEVDV